jgi:1-acyl-sn-glycerol-3-phosphate acyltransferase
MKKVLSKVLSYAGIFFMVYVVGLASFVVFLLLKWTGKIRIVNPEKLPKLRPKMIVISNHPDLFDCMYEVFLMPMLFFPAAFLHPIQFAPYFTPDMHNFTDRWYWAWLKPRAIPIKRGNSGRISANKQAIREMKRVLGGFTGWLIHFLEGGRTRNGEDFLTSEGGKRIRRPSASVGLLVELVDARVLPIWLEQGQEDNKKPTTTLFSPPRFGSGPVVVKIGPLMCPCNFKNTNPHKITDQIVLKMLKLADQ